jgi:hypothetical protein
MQRRGASLLLLLLPLALVAFGQLVCALQGPEAQPVRSSTTNADETGAHSAR